MSYPFRDSAVVVVVHNTLLYVFISCLIFCVNHLHENRVLGFTSVPVASPSVTTWTACPVAVKFTGMPLGEQDTSWGSMLWIWGRRTMFLSDRKFVERFIFPKMWVNSSHTGKVLQGTMEGNHGLGTTLSELLGVVVKIQILGSYPKHAKSEFLVFVFLPAPGNSKVTLKLKNHRIRVREYFLRQITFTSCFGNWHLEIWLQILDA